MSNKPGRRRKDYATFKARVLELLHAGYSINDLRRAAPVPQDVLIEWRDAAGIKPLAAGTNSNRKRLPFLESI